MLSVDRFACTALGFATFSRFVPFGLAASAVPVATATTLLFIASTFVHDIHVQPRELGKLRAVQKFAGMARFGQDAGEMA